MYLPPRREDFVWHYTGSAGLLGILDVGPAEQFKERLKLPFPIGAGAVNLWFTDAQCLNDPQELIFGHDLLAAALREVQAVSTLDEQDEADLEEVLEWLDNPVDPNTGARRTTKSGAYVACFSRHADSLSQWRGYAGGRGYTLGFDSNAISLGMWAPITENEVAEVLRLQAGQDDSPEFATTWQERMSFAQPQVEAVRYGEDAAKAFFAEKAPGILSPQGQVDRIHLCHAALSCVKQMAYEVEQEVRAIVLRGVVPFDVQFRSDDRLGIIPYVVVSHLPFGVHPRPALQEVVVGPGDDIFLRQRAVEQLLEQRGLGGMPTGRSHILFRS